ncbi:MAG: type II secretion system protein M [Gammaproteobacteria bacterium]|nr:type II secretion system protein M [Gammaproteobacteria bacterium]
MSLRDWYEQQSPRDRRVLLVGAGALGLALLWLVVIKPFGKYMSTTRLQVEGQRELLGYMRQSAAQVLALRGQGGASGTLPGGMSLAQAVNQAATENGLTLSRWQPDGEHKLQLWLDDADFDALVIWLGRLESQYGARVDSIAVNQGEAPGRVKVRLALVGG